VPLVISGGTELAAEIQRRGERYEVQSAHR
jgi:hypothetical protein